MAINVSKCFLILIFLSSLTGCISESNFRLSEESRLPKWFELPENKKRAEVTVKLYYYVKPSGREAKLVLENRDGFFSIDKTKGKLRGLKPLQLESASGNNDPVYEVLSADGITDIIGHKGRNDIFYMVDDPAVWSELGIKRD